MSAINSKMLIPIIIESLVLALVLFLAAGTHSHNLKLLGHNNLAVIQECLPFKFSTYCNKHDRCNYVFFQIF